MNKLKLDLPVVLPPEAAHADPCLNRLLTTVRARPGVLDAHVDTADAVPRLCVHFDASVLAPSAVEKLVRAAGAELATQFGHINVAVRGIRHERHARVLEAALVREKGVLYAAVNFGTRRVALEFDPKQLSVGDTPALGSNADLLGLPALEAPIDATKLERARLFTQGNPLAVANVVRAWMNGEEPSES